MPLHARCAGTLLIAAMLGAVSTAAPAATVAPGDEPRIGAAEPEFLCLKDLDAPLTGLSIACYTDAGCAYVQKNAGDPLPDYEEGSVAYALGREKIEGIVTASQPIISKVKTFGYACKALN